MKQPSNSHAATKLQTFLVGGCVALGLFAFFFFFAAAQDLTPQQEREQLEKELQKLEEEIKTIEGDITKTQQEKKTLQNQISLLKNKIKKLDLQIAQSNTIITDLRLQIQDTTSSIEKTEQEIAKKKKQLKEMLQRLWQEDKKSRVEILFSGPTLSDFFTKVAALKTLNQKNQELLTKIEELALYLGQQRDMLDTEKTEEEHFVKIQTLQKQENQGLAKESEQLLEKTKGKESEYQKILGDKKKEAQLIRSRIFELIGVPEAPTFGEAVEIAKVVTAQTGVRPAFLLAVLTQESNIGKNVGQCYVKDLKTGEGISLKGSKVSKVMKPSRDIEPFLQITKELGRDPLNTLVSCPIPSVGGYGGAMGPAQFIPSTWMLYKNRLDALIGRIADPWNVKDAFLAAGVYLADLGADAQTANAEWCAAMKYFSGGCSKRYRFYGDSVMSLAARYELDIQTLEEGS